MPSTDPWTNDELQAGKAAAKALVEHLLRLNLLSAEIPVSTENEQFVVTVRRKPLPPSEPPPVKLPSD